jgi:hypothetical protein
MSASDPAAQADAAASQDAGAADSAAAEAAARQAELLGRLDRLGLLAMGLAETNQTVAVRGAARDLETLEAAPPDMPTRPTDSAGPTLSFARAARVVRDCIAMEMRIAMPPAGARRAELVGRLDRLGLMGMALAEANQRVAVRAAARDRATLEAALPDTVLPPAEGDVPSLNFSRAARVVRDCVAMELKITRTARREAARAGAWTRKRLNAMKGEVRQHVEKSIRTNAEPRHVNQMLFALDARLDKPEIAADFGTRTLGQIVLGVCRDLEVEADLTGWSDDMLHTAYAAVRNWEWKPPAPAPKHGRAIGLKPDPTIEKLPTGVIGTPGVPPAMDVPPWPHPAPPQQPQPPTTTPPDGGPQDGHERRPPGGFRRPPGASFSR